MLILKGHQDRVRSVAYSPDGRLLVSGSNDKTIRLWDLATGKELAAGRGHKRNVYSVAFSRDGRTVASGSGDKSIRLWDATATGTIESARMVLQGHSWAVNSLAFSDDGETLVSGSGNREGSNPPGEAIVWRHATDEQRHVLPVRGRNGVWCVACAQKRELIALGTGVGHIVLWEPSRTPTGTCFGVGHSGHDLQNIWWPSGDGLREPLTINTNVRCLAFSPDGRMLAAAAGWRVKVWDLDKSKVLKALGPHQDVVWGVTFSPSGRTLATASHDGTARFWDVGNWKEKASFAWEIGKVDSVAFSPDGMTAAAGGEKDIVVWDLDES
jgi:WD40 repeat protein